MLVLSTQLGNGVCTLRPVNCRTFDDYAQKVVMTYIKNQLHPAKRVDIIWDQYFTDSLTEKTRNDRGTGARRKVKPNGCLPNDWPTFLRCSENKTELFEFLSKKLIKNIDMEKCLVVTFNDAILTNQPTDLVPYTIEEAEERIFFHAKSVAQSNSKILVKTVDSDVVVIAISVYCRIPSLHELWVQLGKGKDLKYIAVHRIASNLGVMSASALPSFHALSGCNTTSSIFGKSKNMFYDAWKLFPEITKVFVKPASVQQKSEIYEEDIALIEQYFAMMYSRTCNARCKQL